VTAAERTQVVVIGGGVVGCAVLRQLAQQGIDAILLEAEPSICEGTSKANSAIVHTGFDAKPGTIEATMLRRAAELWPGIIDELAVPFLEVGATMLAREQEDMDRLRDVGRNASGLGVETVLLDRTATRDIAPYLADGVEGALSIPGESVIDPFWLTRRFAESGMAAGARVWTDARVSALEVALEHVRVDLADGRSILADQTFNCAGLWSDDVATQAGDTSFRISPRRGQFLVSEETYGVERIILPLPGRMGKGMLITPIVFGGVLLGPTAEEHEDKTDRSVTQEARELIIATCAAMVPAVDDMIPIRQFAGLRAVSSTGDYIVRPSTAGDRLFHVAGIRSTGISASPAIAEHVVEQVQRLRGWRRVAASAPAQSEMTFEDEAGAVICLCRSVSAGEIRGALRPPLPATTLDAAKRACGTTFGDCQGNLCSVATCAVLAGQLGVRPEMMRKHREGSWLFLVGSTDPDGHGRSAGGRPDAPAVDVVVIGGGLAGIGAALEAVASGVRPLVVERTSRWGGTMGRIPERLTETERQAFAELDGATTDGGCVAWLGATASGLVAEDDGWTVDVQDGEGAREVHAPLVVLACGGYVQPREHLAISGPRPSGVATGDLVHLALDAGLLPGRRAALVGSGRYADGTERRMTAAGMTVLRLADRPIELRGDRRLEAVRGDHGWVEVDLLVLAEQWVPAPFLLRSLSLVDNRPGMPAPTAADGRTELNGLWAAGTCRAPDVDHGSSLEDGRAVVRAAIASREARV